MKLLISRQKLHEIYNALDKGKCVVVDVRSVSEKQLIYMIERAVINNSPLVLTKCVFRFYKRLRAQIFVDKHSGGLNNSNVRIELF